MMSEYEDALRQLREMHRIMQDKNLDRYALSHTVCNSMKKEERLEMERIFGEMERNGWIKEFYKSKTDPISYVITAKGFSILK